MEQFTWTKNRFISVILHRAIAFKKLFCYILIRFYEMAFFSFKMEIFHLPCISYIQDFFIYFHSRNEEKPINMVQLLYKMQTLVYILVSYHKFRCIYRKNMNFNYIIFKLRTPNHETNEIQSLFISCFNRRIYINQ